MFGNIALSHKNMHLFEDSIRYARRTIEPNVGPGNPFPSSPLAVVNSPVEVTVNGEPAEVLGAGATNWYCNGDRRTQEQYSNFWYIHAKTCAKKT